MTGWTTHRCIWALLLLAWGCTDAADKPTEAPSEPGTEPVFNEEPAAVPADQPGLSGSHRPHLNLLNLAHMADLDQGGLFIDFGTPARHKYTVGNWKTGWGKDGVEGDTTYTNVASETGRIYLPIEVQGAVKLRFRLKPIGTGTMQLYLNGKPLPVVRLDKSKGFQEHDVDVAAELVRPGENHLLLRFGDTITVGGEQISVAMDYVRVMGEAVAATPGPEPVRHAQLVAEVSVDGQKRKALNVAAPATLSWYVQVPADAQLSLRMAQSEGSGASAVVRVTPEGGAAKPIIQEDLGPKWSEQVASLGEYAGQLVRLDLEARGAGKVAWSSPSILVPEKKLEAFEPAPSVVVLLIDTLRASKLRTYNKRSRVKTPVLDKVAAESSVFERAQSPENWTKPSVASVLTGLYPLTHGTKKSESKLPQSALMASEVFKKQGFATGTFLANGYVSDKFGFKQGWDQYTNYIRENKSTEAENVFKQAGDWIEKNKDRRFFAYIQTIDPHVPYDPPGEFLKMYDAREYGGQVTRRGTPDLLAKAKRKPPKAVLNERDRERLEALHDAEISYHDKYMGLFVERLKKLGLYDKVLFVVTSDHGEEFYEHGSYGHGHSVYQEMIHVPLIFRWPGTLPAGRVPETVGTLDVTPTILAAAGIKVPEVMEGVNRMDHMRGRTPVGPAVGFSDFLDDRHVITEARWKLILRGLNVTLFDLEKDPGEQRELKHHDHPIAMRYLRTHLGQFLGADDYGRWLEPNTGKGEGGLSQEDTEIDEKTRKELKALGYAN